MVLHVTLSGEPPMPPADADLAFKIEFERGQGNPRRVFDAASELIDAFELFDKAVIGSIDPTIETLMVLEDIAAGSIKIWLRNILYRIPDEALRDVDWRKAVGTFLVKAKTLTLRFLDEEHSGKAAIDGLREELRKLARDTDVRHLPDYAPAHEGRLVASLDQIQAAKRSLGSNDKLIIETDEATYEVNLKSDGQPSEVLPVENTRETNSEGEIILTIRKPDLLGGSMWLFGHGRSGIVAPVKDEQWMADLHQRRIALHSGDALRCRVRFTFIYDETGALIEQKTEILRVLQVIEGSGPQLNLPM
jgi:hypothetical protein